MKNFIIKVNATTGKVYTFKANENVTDDFIEFVYGISGEQFFTLKGLDQFMIISRRAIECVYVEECDE